VSKEMGTLQSATNIASYNSKVQFSQGQVINFPDFNLQYTGKSSTPGPNGAQWSIDDYNFIINKGNNQQQIAWSSGTGLVLPIPFSFNGKNYTIEMAYSQKLGDLSNNELVIEEAPK
jgi:hypothetical protein